MMKLVTKHWMAITIISVAPAFGINVVDFDADDISNVVSVQSDFTFNETAVTVDTTSSPGYLGQSVYGGFSEEGSGSFWSANNRANAGLKLRWNGGSGVAGEAASGLYLFSQDDFLNGFDSGSVKMNAANDTVGVEAGYTNPGDGPSNPAVSNMTLRFVLHDQAGWHISGPLPLLSNQAVSFEAMEQSYFSFSPAVNTSTEAGTIGGGSAPTFSGITWVGFRIDAVRGSKISQGSNVGVEAFSVEAGSNTEQCLIDAGMRHQKIEGFGASGAFYQDRLITHSQSNELAQLLFADLGLDIFRIRNVYLRNYYANKVQTFRDTIALGESVSGRPLKILLSSWSPPGSMKSNGSETGENDATLASDTNGYRYADFATWWADSLDFYESKGIVPEYISIQNEPNHDPSYAGCSFQPGETATLAGYNKAFEAVWQELAERHGPSGVPKMIGPEVIGISHVDSFADALINPDHMYAYAHHLYQSNVTLNPDVLNTKMAKLKKDYGYKPLFQTEAAYLNGNTKSVIDRKLDLAKLMFNALTVENVSAYCYWGLFWPGPDEQGLVAIPSDPNAPYSINAEYYAFKHYSAFVHSDWRRIEVDPGGNGLSISAFASPGRDELSVIIVNEGTNSVSQDMAFNNANVTTGSIYQSTDVLDCALVGAYQTGVPVQVPGKSITTLSLATTPPPTPSDVNVLMIAIDDLLPQLRCYGESQMITPNLDQLAADGYLFNRAYVQQAVCGPSRASIMTGLRPDTTLAYEYNSDFRDTIPWAYTLPQVLSGQGYHSVGIGKIYHVIGGENDSLSWDEPWSQGGGSYGSTGNVPYESTAGSDSDLRDGATTDAAITKLAQLKNQQPFFYGVGYVRPHLPFVAPQAYWDMYSVSDLEFPHTDSPASNASSYAYTSWGELRSYTGIPASGPVSAVQEQNLIHGYYACVSYVDAQIGRLLEGLETEGLAENTIVVVWGDHGWHLGDHGEWCKHTNFEVAARIPLIVKVPWMPGASRIDALVEALDIYPTLLDLCGVEHPSHLQGESLLPLLESPESAGPGEAVSQYPRNSKTIMGYSMRTDRYRYVEWRAVGSNVPAEIELYDHVYDPREDVNIAGSADGNLLAALSAQLDAYIGDAYREAPSEWSLISNGEWTGG